MTLTRLDGQKFGEMVAYGAKHLSDQASMIDALNVFPVPDGDTGTNMNLSMTQGAKEVQTNISSHIGKVASFLARGLLMGARGNSGVILSQLFRGFSKQIQDEETIDAIQFSKAFEAGVETAYKAVMKPVEGTILTVAKEAAKKGVSVAKKEEDIVIVMEEIVAQAKETLNQTPEFLPVLKEVGVVDSGGQGLVTIYEGFLAVLKGEALPVYTDNAPSMDEMVQAEHHRHAQTHMQTEDIEYGYCTEFMIRFEDEKLKKYPFEEQAFREKLATMGDSLLVVNDEELVKVHVHAEQPGEVLTYAQTFGNLINMKIENMREQHTHILEEAKMEFETQTAANEVREEKQYGIVTVALGSGTKQLFESIGATYIIEAGQTMNPSTEDIVKAIEKTNAKVVYVLPNNKNIVMAAKQAAEVVDNQKVVVIPSKTIPQGMTSLLSFNQEETEQVNTEAMIEALETVKSGQVTYAVRDTSIDGVEIKKGQFMGIFDGKIVITDSDKLAATKGLLQEMIDGDSEIVTILTGEDVTTSEQEQLEAFFTESNTEVEVEFHKGNQPLYSFVIAVE